MIVVYLIKKELSVDNTDNVDGEFDDDPMNEQCGGCHKPEFACTCE